jgi:hypothetical protein
MNELQLNQLVRIFNTFSLISTSGENTILMGQCLAALKEFIEDIQKDMQKEEK